MRSRLLATLGVDGLPSALDSLERLAASDSLVLRDAHQLAHTLGREALTRSGSDPAILAQCRPAFASGCYHGVVEGLLRLRGRVDMAELQRMCLAAGGPGRTGAVYECAHGVGHGVLGAVGLHVPTALHHCDSLAEPVLAVSCHQGVFMEAITVAMDPGTGPQLAHGHEPHGATLRAAIDPPDPYSPCDQYTDPYADSCWPFQAFVILRRVEFDAGRALRVCDAAPAERVIAAMRVSVSRSPASSSAAMPGWPRNVLWGGPSGRLDAFWRCIGFRRDGLVGATGQAILRLAFSAAWRDLCLQTASEELTFTS